MVHFSFKIADTQVVVYARVESGLQCPILGGGDFLQQNQLVICFQTQEVRLNKGVRYNYRTHRVQIHD